MTRMNLGQGAVAVVQLIVKGEQPSVVYGPRRRRGQGWLAHALMPGQA